MTPGTPSGPDDAILVLTPAERDAALALEVLLPEELENVLRFGISNGDRIEFTFTFDQLDELQGYIAAAANHTRSRKRQALLDAVFDKIEPLLDAADDGAP